MHRREFRWLVLAVALALAGCDSKPTGNDAPIIATNLTPTVGDDAYSLNEDAVLGVAAPGVLSNDIDPEQSALVAALVSDPSHGVLTFQEDGSFSYTPAANYHGPDEFSYQVSDGINISTVATVSITVVPVNDVPVAANNSYSTPEDTVLSVAAPGIRANDTDIDGDTLTAILVAAPAHGTLTLNANGSFVYTPAANYAGADFFTYKANDGSADSNVATVSIMVTPVNDPPVATDDEYTTANDGSLTAAAPGVMTNDSDPVEHYAIFSFKTQGPAHGTLALNQDGSFAYEADLGFSGDDSFTYKVSDGESISNQATVTIHVPAIVPVSLSIDPSPEATFVGNPAALIAVEWFSDGTVSVANADWTVLPAGVVSLSGTTGTSITATGTIEGTAIVEASFGGFTAQCSVTVTAEWAPSLDPGTVYGTDPGQDVVRYPSDGGAPTTLCATNAAPATGFAMDVDNEHLYLLDGGLRRIDRITGAGSIVSTLPPGCRFMDVDSQGRVYTKADDKLHRYDPVTGLVQQVGIGAQPSFCLAIGPNDIPYYDNRTVWNPGDPLIFKHTLPGTVEIWAVAPAGFFDDTFVLTPGGLAFNRRGEAFIIDLIASQVYRYVDVDGDGFALSVGEETLYGMLPPTHGWRTGDGPDYMLMGLAAPASGGVLVNLQPFDYWYQNETPLGIYRIVDLNNDGDTSGPDETTIYNPNYLHNLGSAGLAVSR